MKNYFPHDHYARSDKKLINLVRKQGMAGLGLYWCLVEMLYEENGWLKVADLDSIAFDLRTSPDLISDLIQNFDLFFISGPNFSSHSVIARLKIIEVKSSKAAKAAKTRWQKCKDDANALKNDANALQTHTPSNAIKEIKVNEIKVNDTKGNEGSASPFIPPEKSDLFPETLPAKKENPKEKSCAKKEKVGIDFGPLDTPEFRAKWEEFKAHRKAKKRPISSPESEQRILNGILCYRQDFAINLITTAIDNGWQGLVFEDTPKKYQAYLSGGATAYPGNKTASKIQERIGVMQEVRNSRQYDEHGNRIKPQAA